MTTIRNESDTAAIEVAFHLGAEELLLPLWRDPFPDAFQHGLIVVER